MLPEFTVHLTKSRARPLSYSLRFRCDRIIHQFSFYALCVSFVNLSSKYFPTFIELVLFIWNKSNKHQNEKDTNLATNSSYSEERICNSKSMVTTNIHWKNDATQERSVKENEITCVCVWFSCISKDALGGLRGSKTIHKKNTFY